VSQDRKGPPLHARLHWYKLSAAEFAVLKAMIEHCWDGSVLWPSIPRIAAYSKLSEKQVQRIIHGWDDKRKDKATGEWVIVKHNPGLVARGILTLKAPAIPDRRKSATYQLNEAVLELDPRMKPYLSEEQQAEFPQMDLPTPHGKPIRPRQKKLPGIATPQKPRQKNLPGLGHHVTSDTVSQISPPDLGTPCPQSGDTMSPNYLREFLSGKQSLPQEDPSGFKVLDSIKTPGIPTSTNDAGHSSVEKLASGLREIIAYLDDAAIRQIWDDCHKSVPDVTPEEILCFAWPKQPALARANNPTGLLIHTLRIACNPDSVDRLRADIRRADDERREAKQREQQQAEDNQRWLSHVQERDRQAEAALAAMPESEREQLAEPIRRCIMRGWPWMPSSEVEKTTRQFLLKHALGEPYELPRPRAPDSS
jgi:hypothetical protein